MVSILRLSQVSDLLNGDRSSNYPSGADFVSVGCPFINAGHLKNGKVDYTKMDYITLEKMNTLSGAKIQHGDILLCLRGSLGKNAYVDKDGGAPASSLAVIRPDHKLITPKYLYHIVSSNVFQKQISTENNGSSQPNLSAQSVLDFEIPVPCLGEQERITSALSDMDELISLLEKMVKKKKAIKQGAMQRLLTGEMRLPGFESKWDEYLLGNIARLINGRAYAQEELLDSGKYPVLRLGNLFTNEHWYYSNFELPEKQYCVAGDLIYAWSATFGPRIWDGEKSIFHYHIWKLQLADNIDRDFLYHYLCYDVNVLMSELQGGTMAHLTKATMEKRKVIIPQINEQIAIAKILSDMDADIEECSKKLKKCKQIKAGMMSELLTGRIRLL